MKRHVVFFFTVIVLSTPRVALAAEHIPWWPIQSIDTMKYSRDPSREKLNDSSFDRVIDEQVRKIAETGATHVAIGTPYDEEFIPILTRWVDAARTYDLNVWFRGNFSGWEEWFGYDRLDRNAHLAKTKQFILNHPTLFEDGDLFTSCPECENGGPGDPRNNGDVKGHQQFLINEYQTSKDAFKGIKKRVQSNLFSMNGDVARLIMDQETTDKLDGVVTIDHYVKTVDRLVSDVESIARASGGRIVLGEFGAPIPDIHGQMNESQQKAWVEDAFSKLSRSADVVGVNYWTSVGGSTHLWAENGQPRQAVDTIRSIYRPKIIAGVVRDQFGASVKDATISSPDRNVLTDTNGAFTLPYLERPEHLVVNSPDHRSKEVVVEDDSILLEVTINSTDVSIWNKILQFLLSLFRLRSS